MLSPKRIAAFTVLASGLVSSVATSYAEPCSWGTWPHDGATAVPLESLITFQGGYLSENLPAITEDVAGLMVWPEGTPVPVTVQVDLEAQVVTLTPEEPLLPNQDYRAYGLDLLEQASTNNIEGGWQDTVSADVIFSTASDPQVLAAYALTETNAWPLEVVLVASQPLDSESLETEGLVVDTLGTMIEPTVTFLGHYEGEQHLAWFQLDRPDSDTEHTALEGLLVAFEDGVTALDGTSLSQEAVALNFTTSRTLDRYRGLRDCRYWE